jgi:hypothetical protein
MEQVAVAAGCSVRTPGAVFRQFRDTAPLAALHPIRPEQVRAELSHMVTGASIGEVARRCGFTNPGRCTMASPPFRRVAGGDRQTRLTLIGGALLETHCHPSAIVCSLYCNKRRVRLL